MSLGISVRARIGVLAVASAGLLASVMLANPARAEDVLQQVGVPASGSCFDVFEPTTNTVAGVSNGGWVRSWGQWANGGRGGLVCSRILSLGPDGWFVAEHAANDVDVLQAVPVPPGGCREVVNATSDWAGVSPGGWQLSWAQWMNGGRGGLVCVRGLGMSEPTAAWYVV